MSFPWIQSENGQDELPRQEDMEGKQLSILDFDAREGKQVTFDGAGVLKRHSTAKFIAEKSIFGAIAFNEKEEMALIS